MAQARVVPALLCNAGSILCFVERQDGQVFPNVSQVAFAADAEGPPGPTSDVALSALGTRLYFLPAAIEQAPRDQLILVDTGDRLLLDTPLSSTADPVDGAGSLRTQMEVLSEAMTAFVAAERLLGVGAEQVLSVYLAVVSDAHLRLGEVLEAILVQTPPTEEVNVSAIVEALVTENRTRMDGFLSTAFAF